MSIEETRLLVHKSIYWINMNADREDTVKNYLTYLDFQATQPKNKIIPQKIPGGCGNLSWADIFTINNKNYICIVDYND